VKRGVCGLFVEGIVISYEMLSLVRKRPISVGIGFRILVLRLD